ncbi:MAG: DUF2795 domain-containing protein [Candidatus Aquicultorales bacterium]
MESSGRSSLMQALEGIEFPLSKEDLLDCFGENEFEVKGRRMTVKEAIADCPHGTYNNMDDITMCPSVQTKLAA